MSDAEFLTHAELVELQELGKWLEPNGDARIMHLKALVKRALVEIHAQRDRASIVRNMYAVDRWHP